MKDKGTLTTEPLNINGKLISYSLTTNPRNILCCRHCGTHFVNAIDKITGKKSKYLWIPNCNCMSKQFRVSVG